MSDTIDNANSELEGDINSQNSDEIYPNAIIKVTQKQYSIFELKRQMDKKIDFIISPEFQRNEVWTAKQKSELIESILMGLPIPLIYLFETKDGKKAVVDGRQRLTTFTKYMNNQFALKDLRMLPNLNGKKFEKLESILQSKIEDYQIMAYVIQPPTPERIKFDIFDRVNRGGTQLNNQEMRNALYQGNATKLLNDLSDLENFKNATGNSIKPDRMKDKYIILRFIAFYLLYEKKLPSDITYKSNIDDFLASTMEYLNDIASYNDLDYIKNVFEKAMDLSFNLFKYNGFRFKSNDKKRPVNMALFEALSYLYSIINDSTKLKKEVIELKQKFDESEFFIRNVDGSKNVQYRFGEIQKLKEQLDR